MRAYIFISLMLVCLSLSAQTKQKTVYPVNETTYIQEDKLEFKVYTMDSAVFKAVVERFMLELTYHITNQVKRSEGLKNQHTICFKNEYLPEVENFIKSL